MTLRRGTIENTPVAVEIPAKESCMWPVRSFTSTTAAEKLIGTLKTPQRSGSLVFAGSKRKTLYIGARASLYSIRTRAAGNPDRIVERIDEDDDVRDWLRR